MDTEMNRSATSNGTNALAEIAVGIIGIVLFMVWDSIVTVSLWTWIAVPVTGVREITLAEGFALGLLVGWFTQSSALAQNDKRTATEKIIGSVSRSIVVLGMGFIAHLLLRGV